MAEQQQPQQGGGAGKLLQDALKDDKDLQNTVMGWLANLNLNIRGFNLGDILRKFFAKLMGQDDATAQAAADSDENPNTNALEEDAIVALSTVGYKLSPDLKAKVDALITEIQAGTTDLKDQFVKYANQAPGALNGDASLLASAVDTAFNASGDNKEVIAGRIAALVGEAITVAGAAAPAQVTSAGTPATQPQSTPALQGNFNESSVILGQVAEGVDAASFAKIQKTYDDPTTYFDTQSKPMLENIDALRIEQARGIFVQAALKTKLSNLSEPEINGMSDEAYIQKTGFNPDDLMAMDEKQFTAFYSDYVSKNSDVTFPEGQDPASILAMGRDELFAMTTSMMADTTKTSTADLPKELVEHISAALAENNIDDPDKIIAKAFALDAVNNTAALDAVYDPSTGDVGLVDNGPST